MLSTLFGFLIIIFGIVMIFKDVFWGLTTFAIFTHIPAQQLSSSYIVPLRPALLLSLLTFFCYFFSSKYKGKFSLIPMPEIFFFSMFIVAMVVGSLNAYDFESAWNETETFLKFVLFFLLMVNIIDNNWKISWFYNSLILSAAWMVYKCWDLRGTTGPRFENHDGGVIEDANAFGSALVIMLPIVAIRISHGPWWVRLGASIGVFGIIMSIVITGSRSSFLGLVVSAIFFIYLFPKIRIKIISVFLILGVILSFVPYVHEYYLPRIGGIFSSEQIEDDGSAQSRMASWDLSIDVWKRNVFFGCGLQNFGYYMGHEREGKDLGVRGHVTHNLYLQTLSEAGIIGFLSLCSLLICFFVRTTISCKNYNINGLIEKSYQVRALQVGMAGFMVAAFFQNRLLYEPIYWWIALAISHYNLSRSQK